MKNTIIGILLVVLIEAIGAVAAYLKQRLFRTMRREDDGWENHPDFV